MKPILNLYKSQCSPSFLNYIDKALPHLGYSFKINNNNKDNFSICSLNLDNKAILIQILELCKIKNKNIIYSNKEKLKIDTLKIIKKEISEINAKLEKIEKYLEDIKNEIKI